MRLPAGNRRQGRLEIGEGLDPIDLAGFDEDSVAAPSDAAFVMPREECILAIDGDWADQVLDPDAIDLDILAGGSADRGENVSPFLADLLNAGRALATPPPEMAEPTLFADAGFVFEL